MYQYHGNYILSEYSDGVKDGVKDAQKVDWSYQKGHGGRARIVMQTAPFAINISLMRKSRSPLHLYHRYD